MPYWLADFKTTAKAAYRWWIYEISSLLPNHLKQFFLNFRTERLAIIMRQSDAVIGRKIGGDFIQIDILPLKGEQEVMPVTSISKYLSNPVIIYLSSECVLRRKISLPNTSRKNLNKILSYEIEKYSPINTGLISYDYTVISRDKEKNKINLEVRIVKREDVDRAIIFSRSIGVSPSAIAFSGDPVNGAQSAFLPQTGFLSRLNRKHGISIFLAILGGGLIISIAATWIMKNQEDIESLERMLKKYKIEYQAVENLHHNINETADNLSFLSKKKQDINLSKILSSVSRDTPDGSWIFQFEMNGSEIRIHGYSPSASELIGVFDGDPLFTNARFRAPVTKGPNGELERFDLSFDLKRGGQ